MTVNCFSQKKNIVVKVDESIELITITQLLFGYPLVGKADIQYKSDVLKYFTPYENDTTIAIMKKVAENGFSFVKPFNFMFHFSFPDFKLKIKFSDYENNDLGFAENWNSLSLYNKSLRDFYYHSRFHDFFLQHQDFYDSITNTVNKVISKHNLVNILEKHYGTKQKSYTLILSPLFIEAGMSTWINAKGGNELYSIIGPNLDSKVSPDFDTSWIIQNLVLHEFSHPFCNPFIDKYYPALEKDSCLFAPLKKALKQQGCGDWKSALKEFLTRANEIVLVKQIFGKTQSEQVCNNYINQKWVYIKGIIPLIEKFQSNRKKYKSLDDLMPEIVEYFDNEALQSCK